MALQSSASIANFTSFCCKSLLPLSNCIPYHASFTFTGTHQAGRCYLFCCPPRNGIGSSQAHRLWRFLIVKANSSQRWTLDDVERISKGKASKAKTGSRAVPHRLQTGERTAYELAKKKGYLVQRAVSRRYPLVNTYRNYCDAMNQMCVFIQQGQAGTDTVVIDLSPLRLGGDTVQIIREQIMEVVQKAMQNSSPDSLQADGYSSSEEDGEGEGNQELLKEIPVEGDSDAESTGILRFSTGRSEAKAVCQAAWEFWQSKAKSGRIPLSN